MQRLDRICENKPAKLPDSKAAYAYFSRRQNLAGLFTTSRSRSPAVAGNASTVEALSSSFLFGNQLGHIHQSTLFRGAPKCCDARLDRPSFPLPMILPEDMGIVGQQGFEYRRVQSRVTVSHRNRRPQVCLRLPPLTLPNMQFGSVP